MQGGDFLEIRDIKIGVCMCGSFCTFEKAVGVLESLKEKGADLQVIMSFNAANTDTRFGRAMDFRERLMGLSGKNIIADIAGAEPIGPKNLFDILLVCPCTGNTLGKINNGIADTPVTLAVKSHLRNEKPVVLCIATNDGLGGNFQNIGQLMNKKFIYFVPFCQDDCGGKPRSLMADFSKVGQTLAAALECRQIQPVIFGKN